LNLKLQIDGKGQVKKNVPGRKKPGIKNARNTGGANGGGRFPEVEKKANRRMVKFQKTEQCSRKKTDGKGENKQSISSNQGVQDAKAEKEKG